MTPQPALANVSLNCSILVTHLTSDCLNSQLHSHSIELHCVVWSILMWKGHSLLPSLCKLKNQVIYSFYSLNVRKPCKIVRRAIGLYVRFVPVQSN
ncbi:hypothetical protein F0562_034572 [Nyssa sinensis]|uniref:Uncharacterized protein n=1 Tax=Nyssa sinensis TaxID=561372 RepID=A0A5J5ADP6_9ASTE|nr:hypothetical protein F0562_034572 [Nyssa sinensis]